MVWSECPQRPTYQILGPYPVLQLGGSKALWTWDLVERKEATKSLLLRGIHRSRPLSVSLFSSLPVGVSDFLCFFIPTVMHYLSDSTKCWANQTTD